MDFSDRQPHDGPLVSVIMANFQAGDKIIPALRSVLGQTMSDLEVIVSDDASQDNSVALVRAMAQADPRVRLIETTSNCGPASCRNRALELARGRWIAIVDADDIIHPERLERLLAAASQQDADIVADDLLLFHEDGSPPKLMLGADAGASFLVAPKQWVLAGVDGTPALGYLKPMIRADCLKQLRYDEALRIGEDYDFILRLLLDGARMLVVPEPFYLYRRHSASTSHRLSEPDMRAMIERQLALTAMHAPLSPKLSAAFAKRLAVLRQGLAYEELVASIKQGKVVQAFGLLARDPGLARRLWVSFNERRGAKEPVDRRSQTLVLGGQGMAGADQPVPDYVPAHLVDWSVPRPRDAWRELASHAGSHCIALDEAGSYAAGFVPEVRLETRTTVMEAS
ncbi:glycosyltransferase family 2 protein [Devosia sp. A449]